MVIRKYKKIEKTLENYLMKITDKKRIVRKNPTLIVQG